MRLSPCTPVLARPDGSTQIGVAEPLILSDLTDQQRLLLASAETTPLGREALTELGESGERLIRAGLLVPDVPSEAGIVAIHSGGRLGLELGAALAAAGITVGFVDPRPSSDEPSLYPARALIATCAGGAAWAVRERHPSATVTDPSDPALAVIISVGGAARHHTTRWEHDGLPHLVICLDERGATVGPMVVPGLTACGRCMALARTEADPAWPLLLDQLSSRRPRVPAALVPGAVAAALPMIVAHLEGGPETGAAWRINLDGTPEATRMSAHPDCGCGAWQGDEDTRAAHRSAPPSLRLLPGMRTGS